MQMTIKDALELFHLKGYGSGEDFFSDPPSLIRPLPEGGGAFLNLYTFQVLLLVLVLGFKISGETYF